MSPRETRSVQSREHLEATLAAQTGDHVAHALAVLSDLNACVPCGHARRERPERFRDLARGLVAHLVADVAVGFDLIDPVMLRPHLWRDAVAGRPGPREFLLRRNVDQRVPVVGRIDSSRGSRVRSHVAVRGKRRPGSERTGEESVSPYPRTQMLKVASPAGRAGDTGRDRR